MLNLPFKFIVKLRLILLWLSYDQIFGVLVKYLPLLITNILSFLLTNSLGAFRYLTKNIWSYSPFFSPLPLKCKLNLVETLKLFALIMHMKFYRERFHHFWVKKTFYTSSHVLIHPNKVALLNERTYILLTLPTHAYFIQMCQFLIGVMLFYNLFDKWDAFFHSQ